MHGYLGTPVVPFFPFYFGVSLLELNSRKEGTLIIHGLLGNLGITPMIDNQRKKKNKDHMEAGILV